MKFHLYTTSLVALALITTSNAFVPQPSSSFTSDSLTVTSRSATVVQDKPAYRGSSTTLYMGTGDNLFDRFTRVIKSNVNNFIKSVENPEKVINQAVEDMQTDLVKIRQAYAEVTASQRRLQRQQQQADSMANDWYNKAQFALQRNNEGLAREALARRQQQMEKSKSLQSQIDTQTAAIDRLYDGMQALESKIVEAQAKKEQMIARARTAKTTQKVNDMISGITGKTSMDAFNRMEERVLALEAAAEVSEEMGQMSGWKALSPGSNKKSLEQEFQLLEASDAVDKELQKMKGLLKESSSSPSSVSSTFRKETKIPITF